MPGYAWCGPSMSEIEAIREYTYQFQHFLPLSCVTPHFSLPLSPSLFTSCVPEVRVQYGCPLLQEEGNDPHQKTFIHKQAVPASVRSPRYICTTSLSPPPSSPSCYPLFYSPNPLAFSVTLIILSHLLSSLTVSSPISYFSCSPTPSYPSLTTTTPSPPTPSPLSPLTETHRSAPTTPVKTHSGGFRRNLSFGATTTTTKPPSCVLARPCKLRLLEYAKAHKNGRLE